MTSFLYSLLIEPLETVMTHVLHASFSISGSWGESLILLSLAVNIALIPVYHIAESWQEEERKLQMAMAAKLKEIKEVYKGREKDMYIRALYRLYGYTPLYSLRTSLGLFIQIPFFFAAFHLLNFTPDLAGQSFLFIKDLSKADALIPLAGYSINFLPFFMTAVNILSARIYTSRLSQGKMIQVYGLAALFLVLLYTSSSALLIYWTCNNIFSFFKNIVYTKYIYDDGQKNRPAPALLRITKNFVLAPFQFFYKILWAVQKRIKWADIFFAFMSIALLILSIRVRKKLGIDPYGIIVIALACISGIIALGLRLSAFKNSESKFDRSFWGALFSAFAIILLCTSSLTAYKKLVSTESWIFYRLQSATISFFAVWALSREPFYLLFKKISLSLEYSLTKTMPRKLFIASTLTVAALLFWYTPIQLYVSDPKFFYEPLFVIAGRLGAAALISFGIGLIFFRIAPKPIQPLISVLAAWAACLALFFTFLATGDYGHMDGFIFNDPASMRSRMVVLIDASAAALCFGLLFIVFYKNKGSALISLFHGLAFILVLIASVQALSIPKSQIANLEDASSRLPEYSTKLLSFSPQGKNVVILMLDMFTGGHMQKIIDEEDDLLASLDGFVWYPDTISPGSTTLLSVPAMLGGHSYTPHSINQRANESLLTEMHKGMAGMVELMGNRDYSLAYADIDELVTDIFEKSCPQEMLVVGKSLVTDFTPYWRHKNNLPSPMPESLSPFMASVGFFYASPWTMRQHIYSGGSWMNTQSLKHNPSEGPLAFLELMPEISNTDSTGNTFRYISSQLPHYPWRLDKDSCMPSDEAPSSTRLKNGMIIEHYYNERCTLRSIKKWLDWLKENDLYDNSQIIIISDHSAEDSYQTGKEFQELRHGREPWKPHALLLMKSYNSRGPLKIDNSFMSGADLPWLVCRENGPCPEKKGVFDPFINNAERVRTHDGGKSSLRRHGKNNFNIQTHEVKGSMFKRESWKEIR